MLVLSSGLLNPAGSYAPHERSTPAAKQAGPSTDFVDLNARGDAAERHRAAADAVLAELAASSGRSVANQTTAAPLPLAPTALPAPSAPAREDDLEQPLLGGLSVVHLPRDAYVRGSLASPRRRNVFQTSTASRIWAYYLAMPEAGKTRRLVPPAAGTRPSKFNTPLPREVLKFSLSAGGRGLSEADQMAYVSVLLTAERGWGRSRRGDTGRGAPRQRRNPNLRTGSGAGRQLPEDDDVDQDNSDDDRQLARAFPTRHAFVEAVRGKQRRVLAKLCWEEAPLEVEGVSYKFFSRDLLLAVLELLRNAGHVQLWGETLGVGSDGTRLRSEIMDSDVFLTEESTVRRHHGSLSFVLGVQLFVDEVVVSWSGAHYMYPIRARVVNVRDRTV